MSDKVDRYRKLQAQATKAQRDADRADGAYRQTLQRLQTDYGVNSIKDAKTALATLHEDATNAEEEYHRALDAFAKEFGELLGADED